MITILSILIPLTTSLILSIIMVPRTMLARFHNMSRFGFEQNEGHNAPRLKFLGGVAFFPIILITIGITVMLDMRLNDGDGNDPLMEQMVKLLQLLAGMALLFVVGLKDDLAGTTARNRTIFIVAASALFPISGLWINDLYGLFGIHQMPFWLGMPFTMVLVSYLTATIYLTDGVDGLATGQCSISLTLVILICLLTNTYLPCVIACAGLGVTLTFFLTRKLSPSKKGAFIGSSASMPLGYLICFVILYMYRNKEWNGTTDGAILAAFCTMLIPAWDMIRVLKSRYVDRRRMTDPDRNLIHHKLLRTGLSANYVTLTILALNVLMVVMNGVLLNHEANITLLFMADLILFTLMHWGINYYIVKYTNKVSGEIWEKSYGRNNWSEEEEESELDAMELQQAAQNILEDKELPKQRMLTPTPDMADVAFIPDGMNEFERNLKRYFDLLVSGMCLIVFSPLFLLSYLVIKLDDGGPAIFRQERIGRFGRPFYIYKYRSMRLDAEKMGPQLSHSGGDDDPRLTKAGRFLRAHHLDELPQLWNVFMGDMAFIGYRPERDFYIKQIAKHDPRYFLLYQIRPGVTSYATLYNGYTDTMEKMLTRLELDLYYLKHRSWWFDCKILFLTFWHIVGGKKF